MLSLLTLNALPKSFSVESNKPAVVLTILGLSSKTCLFFSTIHLPVSSSSTQIVFVALLFPVRLNMLSGSFLILSLANCKVLSLAGLNSVIYPFTTASGSVASTSSSTNDSNVITFKLTLSTL